MVLLLYLFYGSWFYGYIVLMVLLQLRYRHSFSFMAVWLYCIHGFQQCCTHGFTAVLYTHDLMVMLFSLMQRYIMLYWWFYGQSAFMVLLSVYTRGFMALLYSWFFGYGFTVMLYSRFFCSCGVVARCTAARTWRRAGCGCRGWSPSGWRTGRSSGAVHRAASSARRPWSCRTSAWPPNPSGSCTDTAALRTIPLSNQHSNTISQHGRS